jgi:hypothetical protein
MGTPVLADGTEGRISSATARPLLLGGLAALSIGAAAIHFAVTFEHFSEYSLYGVFFLVLSWAQLAWPVVLIALPSLTWAPRTSGDGLHQDVRRLHVPVHQPGVVGGVKRRRDLADQRSGPGRGQYPSCLVEHHGQIAARHELGSEVQHALGRPGRVDRNDMREALAASPF